MVKGKVSEAKEFERQSADSLTSGALAASSNKARKDSRRHSDSLRYCTSLHMVMNARLRFASSSNSNLRNCGNAVLVRLVSCFLSERMDSRSNDIGSRNFSLVDLQALRVFQIGQNRWWLASWLFKISCD